MADDVLHLPEGATTFFLAVILGVSIIGFVAGTDASEYADDDTDPAVVVTGADAPIAPTYAELRDHPRQARSGLEEDIAALAALGYRADGSDREAALAARAARRAYDGAPPTIPHPIRQDSAPECLTCHDAGMQLRGRHALPMSHRELTSCTQCHVVAQTPMPGIGRIPADPRDVANAFAGMASPDHGPRAWTIAPPQIPHKTVMRERCDSCHGPNGRSAMQTPHPYRGSCQQCHTAPAELDQRPGVPR